MQFHRNCLNALIQTDQEHYPGQRIYFVIVEEYIHLVPHVLEKEYIFLKTIIPSRKATKAYQDEKEGRNP